MEESTDLNNGQVDDLTQTSLVAADEPPKKLLDDVDPVWVSAILICIIIIATRVLTSSNVERERPIAGGHYKGKVTPGWMKHFQKQEALREEAANRTYLQAAIRARRR